MSTVNCFIPTFSKKRQEAENNRKLLEYFRLKSDALGAENVLERFCFFFTK